jgi:hypothetical protein
LHLSRGRRSQDVVYGSSGVRAEVILLTQRLSRSLSVLLFVTPISVENSEK